MRRTSSRPSSAPQTSEAASSNVRISLSGCGGRERTLTLVCAPAGYGKTTLLAQWAAADADRTAFAWVSLDAMDSDPARLWAHVITALQEVHERVVSAHLAFAAGPSGRRDRASAPHRRLSDSRPVVLVLEDWRTESRACDESLSLFVDRAPSEVQVVISTRHDPRLPIARLRAHGDLTELRARDLSVSATEAVALGDLGSADDVRKLTERTEGWLAGLCLAAIVLKEQADPRRFVHEFSGDMRDVFDYLARDVLATAEPRVRDFMAHSSVLERLSAPCATPSSSAPTPPRCSPTSSARTSFSSHSTRPGPNTGTTISSRMS